MVVNKEHTGVENLLDQLFKLGNSVAASHAQRFFKTGPGEYGEGDKFIGVRVPVLRSLAKANLEISKVELKKLLTGEWHEARLLALLILVYRMQKFKGNPVGQQEVVNYYLANLHFINNWDLVDCSARDILGKFALNSSEYKSHLDKLVRSNSLWERRIAMVATWAFIQDRKIDLTLKFAKILLPDKHDLIHKAVGWMLREAAKVDQQTVVNFLQTHKAVIPRTALRYAIERFDNALKADLMLR